MVNPPRRPIALTIAGSDSSGGAGIQADLKTFTALGVYGAAVIAALTAQNTRGVTALCPVPPEFIAAQIAAVAEDLAIGAVKTGMLGDRAAVIAVAEAIDRHGLRPLVVDPVMIATSGDQLITQDAIEALTTHLLPLATLLTPNLAEAARLLQVPPARTVDECITQAQSLLRFGPAAVLVKGGHGGGDQAVDVLASHDGVRTFAAKRILTHHTHGTGCTLSAAITAGLAAGAPLADAVEQGKTFVWHALEAGRNLGAGTGCGPIDQLFAIAPPISQS